jgi:hypothetical protein
MIPEELDLVRAWEIAHILYPGWCRAGLEFDGAKRQECIDIASAIRLSDEARGYRLMPVDATEEMTRAGCLSLHHNEQTLIRWSQNPSSKEADLEDMAAAYSAMVAASPFAPEKKS